MNRSARGLLSVSVLAPLSAAFAVAVAPVNAAPVNAATGPATALLYETAAATRPATDAPPVPSGAAGELSGTLLKKTGKVGDTVHAGKIGEVAGASPVLPNGRSAEMPVSMALPGDRPGGLPAGLPDLPSQLGAGGLPVGSGLFPAPARRAAPVPTDDLVGQVNDTVNSAGGSLGRTEGGVGHVVDVLKAKDRLAQPADGPLSMPDASALGLPKLPGIG